MDITTETAHRVSAAIEADGRPVLVVAEQTNIPRTTLLRRLSGATPFTVPELARIADLLDVPVHSLIPTADNFDGTAA